MHAPYTARFGRKLLSVAILTASTGVVAQPRVEEVIVTAQKREQNLQDVPISVAAFSGETLTESAIRDVFDLQTQAPLTLATGGARHAVQITTLPFL